MKVKTENNAIGLVDHATSSKLALVVDKAFQKVQEAIFPACSEHHVTSMTWCKSMSCLIGGVWQKSRFGFNETTIQCPRLNR